MNASDLLALLFQVWVLSVAIFVLLWVVQKVKQDAGVVDIGWTMGIAVAVLYYAFRVEGYAPRALLVTLLVWGWALRLAWYLFTDRVLFAKEEDGRYRAMRQHFGASADFVFFFFFTGQSFLVVASSLPMLVLIANPAPSLDLPEALGVLVWIVAITGETIADRQLARWRADPAKRGRTCRAGLWRYSRHPNYFFEWIYWWTYVVMAIDAPWGWVTLLGPAMMLFFLFKVTGIPYTEMQAIRTRGDDYREYQRTTNAFFPWFPRG